MEFPGRQEKRTEKLCLPGKRKGYSWHCSSKLMARNSLQPSLEFVQQLSKSASNPAINLKTTVLKKVYKMNGSSTQPSCLCIEERGYIKDGEKINTVPDS